MIFSKKTFEGFVCIDHADSPGLAGVSGRLSLQRFIGAGQKFEAATNTCAHCERVVVRNPDRTRSRGHCTACDHFLCDPCQADFYLTSECRCWAKRVNNYIDKLAKGTA